MLAAAEVGWTIDSSETQAAQQVTSVFEEVRVRQQAEWLDCRLGTDLHLPAAAAAAFEEAAATEAVEIEAAVTEAVGTEFAAGARAADSDEAKLHTNSLHSYSACFH